MYILNELEDMCMRVGLANHGLDWDEIELKRERMITMNLKPLNNNVLVEILGLSKDDDGMELFGDDTAPTHGKIISLGEKVTPSILEIDEVVSFPQHRLIVCADDRTKGLINELDISYVIKENK